MGITLPTGDVLILPEPPQGLQKENKELYLYLNRLRGALQDFARGQFSNTFTVSTAMNLGTSGAFAIASGGHINVTSGIVTSVTTT